MKTLQKMYRNKKIVLNQHNQRIDQIIIRDKLLTEEDNLQILKEYFNYPLFNGKVDWNIPKKYSKKLITMFNFIPLRYDDNTLIIGIDDAFDLNRGPMLKGIGLSDIKYELMTREQKESLLKQCWQDKYQITKEIDLMNKQHELKLQESDDVKSAPIVLFIKQIIDEAINLECSDIHFEPQELIVNIRFRINGVLSDYTNCDSLLYLGCSTRIKLLANLDITNRRHPQDGRIKWNYEEFIYDLRVAIMPTIYGERIVIRILNHKKNNFIMEELGFTTNELKRCYELLNKRNGIILVTGPTGSGKTTTLYSFLKKLNQRESNIITVEDPVEYMIKGTSQVQVNNNFELNFATSLRAILRQDPNIIMIGEIRDEETAQIAIRAAITGHLVLSTLHTFDATGAVSRLIDMGIPKYLLADSLIGVISQRLMRELCSNCKTRKKVSKEEMLLLNIDDPKTYIYQNNGCLKCHYSGYQNRFAIFEILQIDDELKEMINQHIPTLEIKKKLLMKHHIELQAQARQKVLDGTTTVKEMIELGL